MHDIMSRFLSAAITFLKVNMQYVEMAMWLAKLTNAVLANVLFLSLSPSRLEALAAK